MARHGMRSVTLWIAALPIVLAPSMPPFLVALWTASTAYIYLGVDELGAQVRSPASSDLPWPSTAFRGRF